ncbi:hypothetical protein B0G74_7992 [Paraburkholderia sp. BL9I2N2]|jgi:hypothetical protein|nr:hypothetical protein B0G74_7992 [Paraburkholderia sp. BL9I2N2]
MRGTQAPWYDAHRAPSVEFGSPVLLTQLPFVTRTIMPVQPDKVPAASATPDKAPRKVMPIAARNLLMVAVGIVVFAIVATVVLYGPITYGDEIPNFGIILMLTVPVIAGVAFRVGLDAWFDRK